MTNVRMYPEVRYWTFDDWFKSGGDIRYLDCSGGINRYDSESNLHFILKMNEDELQKLKQYLEQGYEKDVIDSFNYFKGQFLQVWSDVPDRILIHREIELAEYFLYPEKFIDKPEPHSLRYRNYPSKSDVPLIRNAYSEILAYGRDPWYIESERNSSYRCEAEGIKRYLDWLILFRDYLNSRQCSSQAAFDFNGEDMTQPSITNDFKEDYRERVELYLREFQPNFSRAEDYEKLVTMLVLYFNGVPSNIQRPIFTGGRIKTKLASALGNIYRKCVSGSISFDYLELLIRLLEVFQHERLDRSNFQSSNLYKMCTAKG